MAVLGITGGVATGKSTVTRLLAHHLDAKIFDADQCAHELLSEDSEVAGEIRAEFGDGVFDSGGKVLRARLREIVFESSKARRRLEGILHPRIRERWRGRVQTFEQTKEWLLVDIPLMFETGAEEHFRRTLLVGASEETQLRRLTAERRLEPAMARRIIESQMPMQEKLNRASNVVWNDGSLRALEAQAQIFAESIHTT